MKEYLKKLKELKKNSKKKSTILLIIYMIFFIFVFVYIRSHSYANNSNLIDKKENINQDVISNYEYSYEFLVNNDIININGIYIDNKEMFELDNIKYYIQDNKVYLNNEIDEITLDYPLIYLNYNSFKDFIKKYAYESKTEYKDKNIKYEYKINNDEIAKYFNDEVYNQGISNIIVYENNYIYKIEIDLSSYYNVNNYKIIINYNNINNISNIQVNELG